MRIKQIVSVMSVLFMLAVATAVYGDDTSLHTVMDFNSLTAGKLTNDQINTVKGGWNRIALSYNGTETGYYIADGVFGKASGDKSVMLKSSSDIREPQYLQFFPNKADTVISSTDVFDISFDIAVSDNITSRYVMFRGKGNNDALNLLQTRGDGFAVCGKVIREYGLLEANRWYHFRFELQPGTSGDTKANIWMDGRLVARNEAIGKLNQGVFDWFYIYTDAGHSNAVDGEETYFDNFSFGVRHNSKLSSPVLNSAISMTSDGREVNDTFCAGEFKASADVDTYSKDAPIMLAAAQYDAEGILEKLYLNDYVAFEENNGIYNGTLEENFYIEEAECKSIKVMLFNKETMEPYAKSDMLYPEIKTDIIEVSPQIGTAIITDNDFESLPQGGLLSYTINELGINAKSNSYTVEQEDDNKYLRVNKTNSNDTHIDVNFTSSPNYLVVQADYRFEQFGSTVYPLILRDTKTNAGSVDFGVGTVGGSGMLTLTGGRKYQLYTGKWYNMAFAFDFGKHMYDFYINGEKVYENIPVSNDKFAIPAMCRIWVYSGNNTAVLNLDNYWIYEAKQPVNDLSEIKSKYISIMSDGTREKTLLKGRTALCIGNGIIYSDGKKELTGTPEDKDGDYYVSPETAIKLIGKIPAAYKSAKKIPVKAAARLRGLRIFEDEEKYLLIFSKRDFTADEDLIKETAVYMKNLFPSAEEIQSGMTKKNVHPRIAADAETFESIKESIANDANKLAWHNKIMAKADSLLDTPADQYVFGSESGGQKNILNVVRNWKSKMQCWGYAWQMTGDEKYFDAAWEELQSCCSFKDWNPAHTIDTGEALFAAAIGYDWFYDAFSEEQKKFIEDAAYRLGLYPIWSAYYGKLRTDATFGTLSGGNFVKDSSNFNTVVNSGMVCAAMAFADVYPQLCYDSVSKAIQSLSYSLALFEPDGAWEEGANYWNYATSCMAILIGALEVSCETDYGILAHPGVGQTPYYALYLDSYQGLNNFGDTWEGSHIDSPQLSLFGKYLDDDALICERYNSLITKNNTPTVWDMIWCVPQKAGEEPKLKLDYKCGGIDMVSVRGSWSDKNALNFGAHGGKNNVYHGHYDGASWIFDLNNVRWAVDLGMDMSTYVGHPMSTVYRGRAQGHNMLVFNPDENEDFIWESETPLVRFETSQKSAIAVYDNSEGYSKWCKNVTRGFYIGDNRRSLTVRDEFEVLSNDTDVYWCMQTKANISTDGNKAVLTQNGKKLQIEFKTDAEDFTVSAEKAVPINGTINNDWMTDDSDKTRITFKAKASGSCYIEAKLSAPGEDASLSGMLDMPIAAWTNE